MGCKWEDHWSFGEVDGAIGPECHGCDQLCTHNPDYDYDMDCIFPREALHDLEEEN